MASKEREVLLDAAGSALLIIDVQNDFLRRDGYFGRRGLPVETLWPTIAATRTLRDRLPPQVKVIYTVQLYEPDGSDDIVRIHRVKPAALARSDGEIPCRRSGWGAEIVDELKPRSQDVVIAKRRFDAFYRTDLESMLRGAGINTILFAGVIADVCVESSLRSAFMRDFDVVLARDCVAGWSPHYTERTSDVVERAFGASLSNAQILAAFDTVAPAAAQERVG